VVVKLVRPHITAIALMNVDAGAEGELDTPISQDIAPKFLAKDAGKCSRQMPEPMPNQLKCVPCVEGTYAMADL
jgi:hypothetical protein